MIWNEFDYNEVMVTNNKYDIISDVYLENLKNKIEIENKEIKVKENSSES